MDHTFRLPPRLAAISALVPDGARLADVGTDHALLPIRLLLDGKIQSAVATDIRPGPLSRAKENAYAAGVQDLSCVLCDGLTGVSPDSVDTVVIAGMGGETIIHILSQAPWTKAGSTLLLLQPMTKQEDLRRWLNENGYAQSAERLVRDKDYLYPVFTVFGGEQPPLTIAEIYGGVDIEVDPLAGEYLDQRIRRLSQAEAGLRKSSDQVNAQRAGQLAEIRQSLTERRAEL